MADERKLGEEAHFRIDEIERTLAAIKPEIIAALVQGAVSTLELKMSAEIEKLMQAVREDTQTDRDVIAAVLKLVDALNAPVTRTSVIHLPTGDVSMSVTEQRG